MSTTEQRDQTDPRPAPAPLTLWGRTMAAAPPSVLGREGSTLLRHLTFAVLGVAAVVALTYVLPPFRNYQLSLVLMYLIATAGLTVLIGLNGQLSLGHGAIMAVGGYTTAFVQRLLYDMGYVAPPAPGSGRLASPTAAGWTILASISVGVVAAILAGLLIGVAAARLRGPYLAGVTLAIGVTVPAITSTFRVFNGDQGLRVPVPRKPDALGTAFTSGQWWAWVSVLACALALVLLANLMVSRVGRIYRAVRDDEVAAQLSGIHVARTQVNAFVVSSATAGLAGAVFVLINTNAQPGMFGLTLSLFLVLAIVLGGLGSLAGGLWGSIFLVAIPYLTEQFAHGLQLNPALQQKLAGNLPLAIFGIALIVVTILAPGGLQNLVRRLAAWVRGQIRRPAD
jgi:branched-chain amino acid transport system permease protein